MPGNPFGNQQTSSLPRIASGIGAMPGSTGSPLPVDPLANIDTSDNVYPNQITVDSTKVWQLDISPPNNRSSINIQNDGPNDVEIFANNNKPTWGQGWLIKAGGWFSFNWRESIKTYAIVQANPNTADLRILQNIKEG